MTAKEIKEKADERFGKSASYTGNATALLALNLIAALAELLDKPDAQPEKPRGEFISTPCGPTDDANVEEYLKPQLPPGVVVPEGWEWTGEFRRPGLGEMYLWSGNVYEASTSDVQSPQAFHILRKKSPEASEGKPATTEPTTTLAEQGQWLNEQRDKPLKPILPKTFDAVIPKGMEWTGEPPRQLIAGEYGIDVKYPVLYMPFGSEPSVESFFPLRPITPKEPAPAPTPGQKIIATLNDTCLGSMTPSERKMIAANIDAAIADTVKTERESCKLIAIANNSYKIALEIQNQK